MTDMALSDICRCLDYEAQYVRLKPRACRICKLEYIPRDARQVTCLSVDCISERVTQNNRDAEFRRMRKRRPNGRRL